jgi:hypothetical protein
MKWFLFLILSTLCSCSFAGVQHYYKPTSKGWVSLDFSNHNNAIYSFQVRKSLIPTENDSCDLYNFKAGTNNYKDIFALGFCYIPVIPNFLHLFYSDEYRFNLIFEINPISPYTMIKLEKIRFYFNDDTTNTHPIEYSEISKNSQFYYKFDIKETDVNKVLVKFDNITINDIKIDIPDLILEHDWKLFNTMELIGH